MTRFTLVRHGQTDWNLARRIQGTSDIPLNDTGRAQARAAGRRLADRRWDVIAASPLVRARETAELMADEIGLIGALDDCVGVDAPVIAHGIAERCYGDAEGMTAVDLRAQFPDGIEFSVIPGLESRPQVVERATRELVALAERFGDAHVLVATHGAVIGSLLRALTNDELPPAGITVGNGSAHDFDIIGGVLSLVRFDDSGDVPHTASVSATTA